MLTEAEAPAPYTLQPGDRVRELFEREFFARLLPGLLAESGGTDVLDLGCGDGLVSRLAGPRLERYVGVDLEPGDTPGETVQHDLREGLGPVGADPFDLYVATFGVASHVGPRELELLLGDIARHARPGSIVALEALGLGSLEWPRLWPTRPGAERLIPYELGADVTVHPWAPSELAARYDAAGIRPLRALDRTVQAAPKTGEHRYWRGLPSIRNALTTLLRGERSVRALADLSAWLPPLPAGPAADVHTRMAAQRRRVVARGGCAPRTLARRVWSLEGRTSGGFGHGLVMVGRVR
jgi:SAM-dependent methyltransferase